MDSPETIGDVGAVGLVIATFVEVLPALAALLSVIWFSLRIFLAIREIRAKPKT